MKRVTVNKGWLLHVSEYEKVCTKVCTQTD